MMYSNFAAPPHANNHCQSNGGPKAKRRLPCASPVRKMSCFVTPPQHHQQLELPYSTAQHERKRNSFHGFGNSAEGPSNLLQLPPPSPPSSGTTHRMHLHQHNSTSCGASLLNLPTPKMNGGAPPTSAHNSGRWARSSYNGSTNNVGPAKSVAPTRPSSTRVSPLTHANHHQNSTDSAPSGGESALKTKRKEFWALMAAPSSFHQSFDMRSPEALSLLSNSCGHINDEASSHQSQSQLPAHVCPNAGGGPFHRNERRSGFCAGGTSRDLQRELARQQLYCTAPGCSGHSPCAGGHSPHRAPPLRSPQSSFDSTNACEMGLHDGGSGGGAAHAQKDTYLTEISREWMRMNGAIQPFKNILQQASSVTSTPLPNHRSALALQSPAVPAAAAAASTAAAIISGRHEIDETRSVTAGLGTGSAFRNSCQNLAAATDHLIVDQFVGARRKESAATTASEQRIGGGEAAVIIIEPTNGGKPGDGLKKSFSLMLTDDVEAQQQRAGAVSALPGAGGVPNGGPGSEKGAQGSLLNDESNCSVKQPLVREKERGGRFVKRQQLFNRRRVTSDWALFFSLFGIVLMIIENEFAYEQHFALCTALKSVILLSTVCLVGLVVKFHVHEIQIFMNANSAEDWQIALTCRKTMQIIIEIIACAICPLPVKLDVYVTTVDSNGQLVPMRMPLDVLFSIMMFFRLYWLCRVMLLHSRLFTDAASRSIAGLNRVKTDAKFILKTLMTICPGTMLMLFTATLWMIGGYILRLCERQHDPSDPMLTVQAEKHQSYLNSLWLIAVTFLSIGYGDIVPNTQCGRIMAVVTGILGTCTSSMVVAVIARKLELTRAEKHVHNFMIETQHTKELKHIAANVLRETWLIYKNRRLVERIDPGRIRYHQRKFLVAICALRKLKTSQRKLDENRISLGDVAKTTSHSHELMREVHSTQEGLALRITAVEHQLSDIQRELGGLSELLRFAIRPATTTASIECSSGSVGLQLLAGSPMSGGSAQMAEQVRQRRKPSECSTGVELR